jgi:hypothetical protein
MFIPMWVFYTILGLYVVPTLFFLFRTFLQPGGTVWWEYALCFFWPIMWALS